MDRMKDPTKGAAETDQSPAVSSIVRRIADGDASALAELYDDQVSLVFSLAARVVEDQSEAEAVVETVFGRAWAQADGYDPARHGPVAVWLAVMTRQTAIERLRGIRSRLGIADTTDAGDAEIPEPTRPTEAAVLTNEQIGRLRYTLAKLPLMQRMAIELAYFESNSRSQIGERLERPGETVTTQLRLGLTTLRDALKATL